MKDLGTLAGDVSSSPSDINELGQVVGASMDASGNPRAFLWWRGTMTDLNELIPTTSPLSLIYGGVINSRSEITGAALLKGTAETHAFLATPCGGDRLESRECECEIWDIPSARSQARERPIIALPEDVRKLLQRRLGSAGLGFTSK
jgi:probable HAF family extracellular repeat protein